VVQVSPPVPVVVAEDVEWLRIEDASAAGGARRTAERLADKLAFPPARIAELGLAVTEIATNAVRHAGGGTIQLRSLRGLASAVEVLAMDSGPGIPDIAAARRDGHSRAGTLGIGLGAIDRLADDLEVFAPPGMGTVLVARFDADRRAPAPTDPTAAGLIRPITGETACGDGYLIRHDGDRTLLMLCDGLGHGPIAAAATQRAVAALRTAAPFPATPEQAVALIHSALAGTRGGAVAVAELDPAAGVLRFCGLGNIAGAVLSGDRKRSTVSLPGVAGIRARSLRTFEYPLADDGLVVLHSDGLTGRWGMQRADGLFTRPPLVVAAALLREAGIRHDDAGVLVARPRR
jgi:anti-sigma regulatory factor (Ser/Thr protein kinase)